MVVELVEDVLLVVEMQPQTLAVVEEDQEKTLMPLVVMVVLVLWLSDTMLQVDYQDQQILRYNQLMQLLKQHLQQQI